jgi:hypothetical protein
MGFSDVCRALVLLCYIGSVSGLDHSVDDLDEQLFKDLSPELGHAASIRWGENPGLAGRK